MRIPVRVAAHSPWRKVAAAVVISLICVGIAAAVRETSLVQRIGNDVFYNWFYRQRPIEDRTAGDTVIVAADQKSLDFFDKNNQWGWPWPRVTWQMALIYLQKAGARCVVFDLIFSEASQYQHEMQDDSAFADALDNCTIPVVMATEVNAQGKPGNFAPPVHKSLAFGAVNADPKNTRNRWYNPIVNGYPSLALMALAKSGQLTPDWANDPFLLHYYGPERDAQGKFTFPTFPADVVVASGFDPDHDHGLHDSDFRGKIVLIGATAAGTYDLKDSPYGVYPGALLNATAIENMIFRQRVRAIPGIGLLALAAVASFGASLGSIFPRRLWLKFLIGLAIVAAVVLPARFLFLRPDIRWLDPSAPILATVLAIILSLGWSYFAEDRQARFFLKALGQYLSPHVAAELRSEPDKLSLSTETRELTIFFSDIADFTTISERLKDRVGPLLNFYLDEMSEPVLQSDGTLDKYIGDAIVCFWNAPLLQPDHAPRACRAALAMRKRLSEMRDRLAELGEADLEFRVGINTGLVQFGNMGSSKKFNYSVIGDAVNFASRLEGANKFYGTHLMLGQTTAEIVRSDFALRKLDVLKVKGKKLPATVFELLGEGAPAAAVRGLVQRYESAFEKYQSQDWPASERILLEVLQEFPHDGPSTVLLERVRTYRHEPPGQKWDGVYVAKSK